MFNTTGVEESCSEITLAHTVEVKKMGWTHQWASSNVLCTCDMKTIHLMGCKVHTMFCVDSICDIAVVGYSLRPWCHRLSQRKMRSY